MDLHRPRAGDSGGSGGADDGSAEPASAAADTPISDPTAVDNPLFPIGELHSAVLLGNEERHPLRIETVLLPEPKVIGANLEALALAVPTDARTGGVPAELETISRGAAEIFAAAGAGDWEAATSTLGAMDAAWAAHQATGTVPPLLDAQMSDALDALAGDALVPAVADRNPEGARNAALDVEMAALDLQLQYRPPAEIDLGRFSIWADQLVVDAASDEPDAGLIVGDVTSLEWSWDRIAHTVEAADADDIQAQLEELRAAADDEGTAAAAEAAPRLVDTISRLRTTT